MGTGYTRNDTANNIANGNIVDADDLDGEFDAIEAAFSESTGHTHDGTADEGGAITVTGPAQEYVSDGVAFYPKTDDTYDLGKSGYEWKDIYIDGTAYLDTATAGDLTATGTVTLTGATVVGFPSVNVGTQVTASRDLTTADFTGRFLLEVNSSSDVVLNIPLGLTGVEPLAIQRLGTGGVTLTAAGGVTIHSMGGSLEMGIQYSFISIIPKGSETYAIVGNLV